MKNKIRNGIALSIIPQIIVIQWAPTFPEWVERYYSNGLYPVISDFLRSVFGSVPFSVGDIIYTLLIILALRYIKNYRKHIQAKPFAFGRDLLMLFSIFYFTFHILWGLNYYREPLAKKFDIEDKASYEDITALTVGLIKKTNQLHMLLTGDSTLLVKSPYSRNEIFQQTIDSYDSLAQDLPFLTYQTPSIKTSVYSSISSYMGIGGYLNPFTNEAQVNSKTPPFRFTVVSGHEIGHQIGYSAENETNFIGYLVTTRNRDIYFKYSANAYALSYCLNAIRRTDKNASKELYQQLNAGVIKNYKELHDFNQAYENPFEPVFKSFFSAFLKANNQKDGIKSYGKVVNLMVGYHKKYPL